MQARARFVYSVALGVCALVVLAFTTVSTPDVFREPLVMVFLATMIAFTTTYSVSLGAGVVSLMPMTVAAAYLTMGTVPALWTVLLGLLGQAGLRLIRGRRHPELHEPRGAELVERTAMNVGMHSMGLLAGAWVVEALGVVIPLEGLDLADAISLLAGEVAYLAVNYFLAALWVAGHGGNALWGYVRSLGLLTLFEGTPILIAPLFPLILRRLGPPYFLVFAASLAVASVISHGLSQAQQRLQRRVSELASLQAVGQALSASLDVETVLVAVYEQVSKLMLASSFYIALYDAALDEVSFPMVIENGERRLRSQTRRAGNGLTEHVIRSGAPLLLAQDVANGTAELGLESIGRPAQCWLGVPMTAGDEVLGVMAVQSFERAQLYDRSHLEVFQTIALQAAIALQNARLYERTDETLARRVQELDSVLRTTDDGVLLMDLDYRVLAVNRALAEFVGVSQSDFGRHPVDALRPGGEPVTALIHYDYDTLVVDSERLKTGTQDQILDVVVFQPAGPHAERTLTPVRDDAGAIVGWLLTFRDLTEELELQHLREDMIDMLIHDLRSPITLVMASLAMLGDPSEEASPEQAERLIGIAQRSSDRMLSLIDELLDISQLERGQLPLDLAPTSLERIIDEVVGGYLAAASANSIALTATAEPELGQVLVDRSLVGRVLANLVDNALKFTPDGGAVVVSAQRSSSGSDEVEVAVSDNGPGVPPESRGKLFEKFQQVDSIRGRRRGTGLGLPFCKLVVEAHGGTIWVDSEVGRGSVFRFSLPTSAGELSD